MGVWDLMMFQQKIDKWMKLALDESFSEADRALYLEKAEEFIEWRKRYLQEWDERQEWRKENPYGYRCE